MSQNRTMKNLALVTGCMVGVSLLLAACGGTAKPSDPKSATAGEEKKPLTIDYMTMYFSPEPGNMDNPVIHELEKHTNVKLNFLQVPAANIADKINTTIASGNVPALMRVPNFRDSSVINAVRAGMFWEVGPYLKEYPNLNRIVKDEYKPSISYDGKVYGLPFLGMSNNFPVIYRKDWADKLKLPAPKSVEDLYAMAKAFTEKDPDGDGKNDTFGFANYSSSHVMAWFGAPNGWSLSGGKFTPDFEAPEFIDGLKYFKKMYDEKLVPQDFAMMNQQQVWDLMSKGKAGIYLGNLPHIINPSVDPKKTDPKAELDFVTNITGPKGDRIFATNPAAHMLFISKTSVKTVDDLKRVLQFLDEANSQENVLLSTFGLESTDYTMKDGKVIQTQGSPMASMKYGNVPLFSLENTNYIKFQYLPGDMYSRLFKAANDNSMTTVYNPAEAFVPKTKIDPNFSDDLQKKFLVGAIDEAGLKAEIQKWHNGSGNDYIKELESELAKTKK